jgi:GT2 family glycosyltransferase
MGNDGVDIVVLNCNNKGYIENCINSILRYTQGLINLIVVDQGSTDGSREWLKQKKISHLILNTKNAGVGEGRNQGIKVGRYSWVSFIDSDIEIKDSEWLDKLWNYTTDSVGFIEGAMFENNEKRYGSMAFNLVRREVFREVGLFDKKFFVGEDLDFYVRMEWAGWQVQYCPDTNVIHYGGGTLRKVLGDEYQKYEQERDKLLSYKYSYSMLKEMLSKNMQRRIEAEKVLKEVAYG